VKVVVIDGSKYLRQEYRDEAQLEGLFWRHAEVALGAKLTLLPKTKIRSAGDVASIPDGYAIDFAHRIWYVVEVELARHPIYEHIVPQVSKFSVAIKNPATRRKLMGAIYESVKTDVSLSGDTHKALWDIIEREPAFVIVIDTVTKELIEAKDSLPLNPRIIEFQTFAGESGGNQAALHVFDVLRDPRQPELEVAPETPVVPESRTRPRSGDTASTSRSGKAPRVTFRELASADLLEDGQVLYLCDRQRQRVGQESAIVRLDDNRLEYGSGRREKSSPLALELLKKHRVVPTSLKAVQGPLHWITEKGVTLDELNAEVRRRGR
jgi:hypothetical protein